MGSTAAHEMSNSLPIATLADLAEALSDQPELFSAPDARAVRVAKEFIHTGVRAARDQKLLGKIVGAWLRSGSMRRTAEEAGVSRNTVSAVIRILESSGRLEPLKTRFERERLETGMEQLNWVRDVIESRDLEAAAVVLKPGWVGIGIVSDKEAAQPPASLHLHVHQGPTDGQVVDPVAEYERLLRRARSAAVIDVESAVCPPKALPPKDSVSPATAQATTPPSIPTGSDLLDSTIDLDQPAPSPEGGGGAAAVPPGGG